MIKKFLVTSFIGLFLIIGLAVFLKLFVNKNLEITAVYYTSPIVMVVTIIFHVVLVNATKSDPKLFIHRFLASSGIKMMLYLAVIIIYIFAIRYQARSFLISFLISYIVFTFIEIISILKLLKK